MIGFQIDRFSSFGGSLVFEAYCKKALVVTSLISFCLSSFSFHKYQKETPKYVHSTEDSNLIVDKWTVNCMEPWITSCEERRNVSRHHGVFKTYYQKVHDCYCSYQFCFYCRCGGDDQRGCKKEIRIWTILGHISYDLLVNEHLNNPNFLVSALQHNIWCKEGSSV